MLSDITALGRGRSSKESLGDAEHDDDKGGGQAAQGSDGKSEPSAAAEPEGDTPSEETNVGEIRHGD